MLIDLSNSDLAIIDEALKLYYDRTPGNYTRCSAVIKIVSSIEKQMKLGRHL